MVENYLCIQRCLYNFFFEHQYNQLIVELTMHQELYYATKLERLINIFASGK